MLPHDVKKKFKLLIVGPRASGFNIVEESDPYVRYVYSAVERLDLRDNVVFIGSVPEQELPKYYSASDFLVHTSLVEAFGLTLVEALACGKPIIAFDVPPINEIIKPHIGLLAKVSIKDLASKIEELIVNEHLRKTLSLNARNFVLDNYSWNTIIKRYIDVYKLCMNSAKDYLRG